MVDVLAKIGEVVSKSLEKLAEAPDSVKEKVGSYDKPLTSEVKVESKGLLSKIEILDKPLNSDIGIIQFDENGLRPLTASELQALRDNTNLPYTSKGILGCKMRDDGIIIYPSQNKELAGTVHPETGVPFDNKVVDINGFKIEIVYPCFESVFDALLPDNLVEATDGEQFKECNRQLYDKITSDPDFAKKFSVDQIEQIKAGVTNGNVGAPDGFVWHHDVETGKMQLVDFDVHMATGHTGGKAMWNGGNAFR